jgi:hypothetical protein
MTMIAYMRAICLKGSIVLSYSDLAGIHNNSESTDALDLTIRAWTAQRTLGTYTPLRIALPHHTYVFA